jgi:hypothetical protein
MSTIPAFSNGVLPIGVHSIRNLSAFGRAFGFTPERRRMVSLFRCWWRRYQREASLLQVESIVVFGSFVSEKEVPRDIDVAVFHRRKWPQCREAYSTMNTLEELKLLNPVFYLCEEKAETLRKHQMGVVDGRYVTLPGKGVVSIEDWRP